MNRICYCGDTLKEDIWDSGRGYRCLSCCQNFKIKYDNRIFRCKENNQCIFSSVSRVQYGVCPNCYDGNNNPPSSPISLDEKENDNTDSLIYRKFKQNFSIIS